MPNSATEYHYIQRQANQSLLDSLDEHTEHAFSKQQLKQFMQQGAVWWAKAPQGAKKPAKSTRPGRVRRAKKPLQPGDEIWFYCDPKVLNQTVTPPTLVADETDYSVWYKPKGMLSQGSKWGDHTTLNRWIEMHYRFGEEPDARPCWIVHRLDKATDGLMLIAHTKKAAQQLTRQFENHQVQKTYRARVHGHFPAAQQHYREPIHGKPAISHARLCDFDSATETSQVEVRIETGRKHQIRRHLSQAGFPIVGDRLYGDAAENAMDLQLTAVQLVLLTPNLDIMADYHWPNDPSRANSPAVD